VDWSCEPQTEYEQAIRVAFIAEVNVGREIARAGTSIGGFHLSDWRTPRGDVTADRAVLRDGCIDIAGLASRAPATRARPRSRS
jgi:hypothetical protein